MKVLVVHPGPQFSVADVYRGYVAALRRLGCDVATFNLNDRITFYSNLRLDGEQLDPPAAAHMASKGLHAVCYEWQPDVVIAISNFFIPPFTFDVWKTKAHKTVLLFTESPYEDDRQQRIAEYADPAVVVVNDPVNLDAYRKHHQNVHYLPHSYDQHIHYPKPGLPLWKADFTFVGTGYPSRITFLEQVDWSGLDVTLAGHWKGLARKSHLSKFLVHDKRECFDNTDAVDLYCSAKMSANLYRASTHADLEANTPELADGWAMGPREVELAACGVFFAREPRGEGDDVLPMLPTFTGPAELESLVRWWTSHDAERVDVALRAKAAVADRTFDTHAARMLQLLDT